MLHGMQKVRDSDFAGGSSQAMCWNPAGAQARAPPMRWLFFATDPDDRLGLAVPSHHHHPGTDAGGVSGVAQRGPASPTSSSSLRPAAKSMRASIKVPPLTRLRVVVGVRHDPVRAADKSLHTGLQVIKAHGEMTRVAAGRLPGWAGQSR